MRIEINMPDYAPDRGITTNWDHGFVIAVKAERGSVSVSANRAGLVSMARHLLALAQAAAPLGSHIHLAAPLGSHIHLDESNSLEDGFSELIVEKI